MNNPLHRALVLLAILCLCSAAHGQSDSKEIQDAELRFSIQMTAALNNDPKGQYLVAEMYEKGVGTPQNLRMAHLWYTKSANQKYAPAIKRLASWGSENQQTQAARERAEEQRRRQAEADAAAAAASAKAARERAEEQRRRQAATEAAAVTTTAIKAAQAAETAPVTKEKPLEINQPKDRLKRTAGKTADKGEVEFKANPCKTPTAKFTSTCQ